MSANLLKEIEHDLDKIGAEHWHIDGRDDALDKILKKHSSLKAQVGV
jgi:hypothetical protein